MKRLFLGVAGLESCSEATQDGLEEVGFGTDSALASHFLVVPDGNESAGGLSLEGLGGRGAGESFAGGVGGEEVVETSGKDELVVGAAQCRRLYVKQAQIKVLDLLDGLQTEVVCEELQEHGGVAV